MSVRKAILSYLRDEKPGESFTSRQIAEVISQENPDRYGEKKI